MLEEIVQQLHEGKFQEFQQVLANVDRVSPNGLDDTRNVSSEDNWQRRRGLDTVITTSLLTISLGANNAALVIYRSRPGYFSQTMAKKKNTVTKETQRDPKRPKETQRDEKRLVAAIFND